MTTQDVRASVSPRSHRARIVLVDDHELARSGLRGMLAGRSDMEVIAEARSGEEAVELCCRLRPDLVLMDVRMPDMDGLAATGLIKECRPDIGVLIVTMYADLDYVLRAVKSGAAGYVLKEATRDELVTAVRAALRGETTFTPSLAQHIFRHLAVEPRESEVQTVSPLTLREVEILAHVVRGKTNRQIAEDLILSVGTVKIHVQHIIAKLGVSDRTQAVVRAIELGIVKPTSE